MFYDLVAHCEWPAAFLAEREAALWLWTALQRMFPNPLAAALMPNHLHLLTPLEDPIAAHARFRRLLASFARSFDLPKSGSRCPRPGCWQHRTRFSARSATSASTRADPFAWGARSSNWPRIRSATSGPHTETRWGRSSTRG